MYGVELIKYQISAIKYIFISQTCRKLSDVIDTEVEDLSSRCINGSNMAQWLCHRLMG